MKKINFLFFICASFFLKGQYMTLQGKQFMIGGTPFYPVSCNYIFEIVHNTGSSTYYLAPHHGWGSGDATPGTAPNPNFNCNGATPCSTNLSTDLAKIYDMGFNSIRTAGIGINKDDPNQSSTTATGFYVDVWENTQPGYVRQRIYITPPYATNNNLNNILFPMYDQIVALAQQETLKVVLDIGYFHMAHTQADADDYEDFLSVFVDHFKTNATIMAYAIIEEPSTENPAPVTPITKENVCNYTNQWYNTVKAYDPNHLVTMSGYGAMDVATWDPSIMKMDFYSPHVYPAFYDYEGPDFTQGYNRLLDNLLWLSNNCPVPWLLAETSFAAIDDERDGSGQIITTPPDKVDGTLTEQQTYAHNALQDVRNCGGSGMGWWLFQETWWGDPRHDGHGLLRHGTIGASLPPGISDLDKPLVQEFDEYLDNGIPAQGTQPNYPANYYDQYNNEYYTPSTPFEFTGTVTNTNTGLPIKDAIVYGWRHYGSFINNDPQQGIILRDDFLYTFTDLNGDYSFNLHRPNTFADPFFLNNVPPPPYARNIVASAVGTSKEERGWDTPLSSPNTFDADLSSSGGSAGSYGYLTNQTVSGTQNYIGYTNFLISNSSLQSSSTTGFTSRGFIHLVPGSSSGVSKSLQGANTHLYISNVFEDCNFFSGYLRQAPHPPQVEAASDEEVILSKDIEMAFKPKGKEAFLSVKPNPNFGVFAIELNNTERERGMEIELYNSAGIKVFSQKYTENSLQFNGSFLSPGMYLLKVSSKNKMFNQKIIIQ